MTIHAVYENGVFRPTETVNLPDRCEVEVEIRQVKEPPGIPSRQPSPQPFPGGRGSEVNDRCNGRAAHGMQRVGLRW